MKVLYKKQIFDNHKEVELKDGLTILEMIKALEIPDNMKCYLDVRINGCRINPRIWHLTRPNPESTPSIALVPAGGDDPTEALKTVAVIAVAYYTGQYAETAKLGLSGAFLTAGATLGTALALNSMFPPPQPLLTGNPDRTSTPVITGQSNRSDPYGVVPRNYGYNRIYPRVVAEPFTYFVGNDQYFIGLYDFGIGVQNVQEANILLGESALIDYNGVQYNIANHPDDLKIYKNQTNIESFNVLFEDVGDNAIRTSPESAETLELLFEFPNGLTTIVGRKRKKKETTVKLSVKVRPTGTTDWINFTNYDYEIDKKYQVENYNEFFIDTKPDVFTEEYQVDIKNIFGTGTYSTTRFYKMGFSSDILKYKIRQVEEYGGGSQPLRVGDQIILPGSNGTRESIAYVTELVSSNHNTLEYSVRVNEPFIIDTRISDADTTYSPFGGDGYNLRMKARAVNDTINIKEATTKPVRFNLKININRPDQYDVWVYWQDIEFGDLGSSPQYINDFVWRDIKSTKKATPITTDIPHTYIEVKIKATDQLSGAIDNLSAECFSVLDYYDTDTGTWKQKETSNPAWIFADILTGIHNQRAISKDQLDIDSLVAWADYCENNTITYQNNTIGFECNFVLDYRITVKELLTQVCSVGRATLNVTNGKFGVVIDELKTIPTQMFNQRNTSNFSIERSYEKSPDSIIASFIDPLSGWQKNEVIAYDDGQDASNSDLGEDMEMFGVTNIAQAWRQGRYFLAQQKLRRNNISLNVDFENLVCSRGDLVFFSHDVMKQGGLPTRVISVSGTTVTLDEPMIDDGGAYVLRSRVRATDEILDINIISFTGTHTVVVDDILGLQADDLVVFGESDTVTKEYIVKEVEYTGDFNATLRLFEYAPEIYGADSGTIPDYTITTQSDPLGGGSYPPAVTDLVASYTISCHQSEKRYVYDITLDWEAPQNTQIDVYEVYVLVSGQQQLAGFTKNKSYIHEVSGLLLENEHEFRVIGVDGAGNKMPIQNATLVTFTPYDDIEIPQDISEFNANLLTETCELTWKAVDDCDIDKYIIRYSPRSSGASWVTSTRLTTASSNQLSVQVPIRTGTYFIKAVDWAGNQSANATSLVTQIPEVLNVDAISQLSAPLWEGVYENVDTIGNNLLLKSTDGNETFVDSLGNFYFDDIFDLGDIFTARFTSSIEASGFSSTSLMSSWDTLAEIDIIAGDFNDDDFDVGTYIRTRNNVDVMANWNTLTEVEYLSFGSEVSATPWQRFTNADFVGRIFQLKVQLEGDDDQTVSPMVYNTEITANWTDRVEKGNNDLSGTPVVFDYDFNETPSIQVTASQNGQPGDTYVISNQSSSGFTVQYYDSGLNAVNDREFDWIAKGFGKKYTLEDISF